MKTKGYRYLLVALGVLWGGSLWAQDAKHWYQLADSCVQVKSFALAGEYYQRYAESADFRTQKARGYYNTACCYALAGKPDWAFPMLEAALTHGYANYQNLAHDEDLASLRSDDARWQKALRRLKPNRKSLNTDPRQAQFHTEDIARFWRAYDAAKQQPEQQKEIFKKYYFEPASEGMHDYLGMKVGSIDAFLKHHNERPRFYTALRPNTLRVEAYKEDFYRAFQNLKALYPEAVFPDVYFIMGAFTSAGTVSDAGLLIGINQIAKTDEVPTDELSLWQKNNFQKLSSLPDIIAHELIHFQQDDMKSDTITLGYAIIEGMADFMGELISGRNSNARLDVWAKGREKEIWARFQKDMYHDRYSNWIGNGDQETPDHPADQGYWVGYQICKAYYDNAADKKKAIHDMLHIQDYRAFLAQSQWEAKVAGL
ncbi:hypothetical protein GCM10027275_53550 [Rhabdobacter roseus]|uniref:DUF2268 domain-containing protein n=1 Tax=Rhabdobacter roseus TaxID=1655419 RepID=A0A840TWV7_9BACT|nr:DUF2268 domain-containing putative Zn-dependent protease [Rhabdobacter roseus]MBB5287415.1 hypothetical protein [Rhabdobacter roseus]